MLLVDDHDGREHAFGRFNTAAWRKGDTIMMWIVNDEPDYIAEKTGRHRKGDGICDNYEDYNFELAGVSGVGSVSYRQWIGPDWTATSSTSSTAATTNFNAFSLKVPPYSWTVVNISGIVDAAAAASSVGASTLTATDDCFVLKRYPDEAMPSSSYNRPELWVSKPSSGTWERRIFARFDASVPDADAVVEGVTTWNNQLASNTELALGAAVDASAGDDVSFD
eukprot:5563672-Prymnesium_polylepis.1